MRKIAPLLFVLAFSGLVPAVNAAGKTTVDPNSVKALQAVETQAIDERLAQIVTYEGGYKRLHTAIDEISSISGVKIYSGSSSKDWQIRDIPVTIYVKDMPLGKLLKSIAKTTHLIISSEIVKGARTYRIWRDANLQKDFDEYFESKREDNMKLSDWSWDALIRAKDLSESTLNEMAKTAENGIDIKLAQVAGKLLADLGPAAKKKVVSGDVITLTPRTAIASTKGILGEFYTLSWQGRMNRQEQAGQAKASSPDDEDIEKSVISIKPEQDGDISISLTGLKIQGATTGSDISLLTLIYPLRDVKGFDLKEVLHSLSRPKSNAEVSDDLKALRKDADWNLPILQSKVLLEKSESEFGPVTADALTALAEVTGMNIICDDFMSHKSAWACGVSNVFGADIPVANVLKSARETYWSFDEENRTLLGEAIGWHDVHKNLVPESTIADFRKKLDGDGAELEDFLVLQRLNYQQINTWFDEAANMPDLLQGTIKETDKALWALYDYISAEDKALSKSESGFPLAKCDPNWLEDALKKRAWVMENTMKYFYLTGSSDAQEKDTIPTDIGAVASWIMRLRSERPGFIPRVEIKGDSRDVHFDPAPADCTKLWYYLEISGEKDGEKFQVRIDGPRLPFPLYSPKREKQLAELATAKDKKN